MLTKYYQLDIELDEEEPFEYDGPNIVKATGCEIQWKEGKNVTQKIVKKKQKKGPHAGKFTTKMVSNESFFNFFNPEPRSMDESMEPEQQEKVREDFEIGQIIRDQVVPRAVLFYTGEAADDYDEFDEEDDEEGGESDDQSGGSGNEE